MGNLLVKDAEEVRKMKARLANTVPPKETDPKVEAVVRVTRLGELVGDISQKMLTKTVRQMERDGLVTRTVHPVIPPRVEYRLTDLGRSLSAAFCGVWMWAEEHGEEVEQARREFAKTSA